jgi:hypothetical protein
MAITGSQKAYTWARSGQARSGAARSGYVMPWTAVDLIVRDSAGNIISRTDIVPYIRFGSLTVSQALNDEPDTCSFQIVPTAPAAAVPDVGQEIVVAWTPGVVEFRGYALVIQFTRRVRNDPPWVDVQCVDAMWRFDARIVTYRFPAQSITASIAFLVHWFVNDPSAPTAADITTTFVAAGMPSIPAFDVVNQRPSTVMRTLMAAVQGGFYLDGLELHAWAGSLTEPGQTPPTPLTNDLSTLKAFQLTQDATQLRNWITVEGRRTATLVDRATFDTSALLPIGLPLEDASMFDASLGVDHQHVVRIGTQWMQFQSPVPASAPGTNPPQTVLTSAYTPGDGLLVCQALTPAPPLQGWVKVGGQFAGYQGSSTAGAVLTLSLASPTHSFGQLNVPIAAGTLVEWVDGVMEDYPLSINRLDAVTSGVIWAQPTDTPVVLIGSAIAPNTFGWPRLEGFVQDGRYSYVGAQARADADLAAFQEPLVTATWETEDVHAAPGRPQVINLSGLTVIEARLPASTLTILKVDVTFPLRTQPPRRRCTGGELKQSTFLDVVVTDLS